MADDPLVMPQDEFEMVRWLFEMTGGPAFPANAVTACRIAAKRNFGGFGDVFARLAEAIDGASAGAPQSPHRDTGDLLDWEGRARAVEAELADLKRIHDREWHALWVLVRQAGGSVFIPEGHLGAVPSLASLGMALEPGGMRVNASEEL